MDAQIKLNWTSKHKNLMGHEIDILADYLNEQSVTELAKIYNVNAHAIKSIIVNNGYKLRSPKESRNLQRYNRKRNQTVEYKFTDQQIKEMIDLYQYGYGLNFIAKKYNVDCGVIVRVLTNQDIHIRDRNEQQQFKHVTAELTKQTIIGKYNGWSHLHNLHKESLRKKYGVDNVMQIPEVFYKQQLSGKKIKETIIDGVGIQYQGYEDKGIRFLLDLGYHINDIKIGKGKVPVIPYTFKGKSKIYYPDIYIPKDNLIVEIKSDYTMQKEFELNIAKKEATIQQGYQFDFLIF
jgi:hypothetical protein